MSTVRSQCVDAAVALLDGVGKPASLQAVKRCQISPPQVKAGQSWIFVRSGEDESGFVGGSRGPLREHHFSMVVDCIAFGDASTAADAAVDPLIAWSVKQLEGSTLGGLAISAEEVKTQYVYKQLDLPSCRARITFVVRHTTRTGDAEQRA